MDEETLREKWSRTLPADVDWDALEPEASYRPRPKVVVGEASDDLPTVDLQRTGRSAQDTVDIEGTTARTVDPSAKTAVYTGDGVATRTHDAAPPAGRGAREQTGGYELLEEIGRGGMGVVFRAKQKSLMREVAIKKILPDRATAAARRRFLTEGCVTGFLDHPNVVPVHELAANDRGEVFLAMKLVGGTSWKDILKRTPRERLLDLDDDEHDLRRQLEILIAVGNAVAYAHSRDLVHLDLKPENVMVGEFGEVLVMDWGLTVSVTEREPEGPRTLHRSEIEGPCGSPAYMPPELVQVDIDAIGPRTDIYLLGATLYEVLAGRPPHTGKTFMAILMAAGEGEVEPLPDSVPAELRAICARALEPRPEDRYQTVGDLQDALKAFLRHYESLKVTAHARADLERARASAAAAGAGDEKSHLYARLADAVAGFRQALVLWERNPEALDGAAAARRLYAETAYRLGDLGLARAQAAELPSDDREADRLRRSIDSALEARERSDRKVRSLRRGLGASLAVIVLGLAIGLVVVGRARNRALESEGAARRSEAEARESREEAVSARAASERQLAWSLVAQGALLTGERRYDEAWALHEQAGRLFRRLGLPTLASDLGRFHVLRESPGSLWTLDAADGFDLLPGRRILAASAGGDLALRDQDTGRTLASLAVQGAPVGVDGLGLRALVDGGTEAMLVVDLTGARAARPLAYDAGAGLRVGALSPSGRLVLLANASLEEPDDRGVGAVTSTSRLVDADTGETKAQLRYETRIRSALFTPNNQYTVVGGDDGIVRVRHIDAGRDWSSLRVHEGPVTALAFSLLGGLAASGGADGRVSLWRIDQRTHRTLAGHTDPIRDLRFTRDGALLLSASEDGTVRLWEVDSGALRGVLRGPAPALRVRLDEAEETIAVGGRGTVALHPFDRRTLVVPSVERVVLDAGRPVPAQVSPDGRLALTAWTDPADDPDGEGRAGAAAWDLDVGVRALALRDLPPAPVTALALAADGQRAMIGTAGGGALIYALEHGSLAYQVRRAEAPAERGAPPRPGATILSVAISPDGRLATCTGPEPPYPVYDLEARRTRFEHDGRGTAAFLDGERLALLDGSSLQVLSTSGGAEIARLSLGEGRVGAEPPLLARSSIAVSSDGARVLVGGRQGSAVLLRGSDLSILARLETGPVSALAFGPGGTLLTAGGPGLATWTVWSADGARRLAAFEVPGGIAGLSSDREGRRILTTTSDGRVLSADLLAPDRIEAGRAAARAARAALEKDPRDGAALAALGAWHAERGADAAAARLLDRAHALGAPIDPVRLARAHARRGFLVGAIDALRSAPGPASSGWLRDRLLEALDERDDEQGSAIGQDLELLHVVRFSPDGARIVSCGHQGTHTLWTARGQLVRHLADAPRESYDAAFSPDGRSLVAGGLTGEVHVYDLETGERATLGMHPEGVTSVALSPDGSLLATGGYDGAVRLFAPKGGEPRVIPGPGGKVRSVAFSADGQLLAVGDDQGAVGLWDLERSEGAGTLAPRFPKPVERIRITDDDRIIAAHTSGAVAIWKRSTGELLRTALEGETEVHDIAIGPGGRLVAAVGRGGRVRVYDLEAGRIVRRADLPVTLLSVDVSPRGDHIVIGGRDGRIVRLRLTPPGR